MAHASIILHEVSFAYEAAIQTLFEDLSLHFPPGWTGVVGANGAGKTTLLRLATGGLKPQRGHVRTPGGAIYCAQRTDDAPGDLAALMEAADAEAWRIKGPLGIGDDWPERWQTLSHGERKRAQIAVALWQRPAILAVDEPTNHLDAEARDLLAAALRSYRGVGLLVSHDRELLDALCTQCVFIDEEDVVIRPGGFSDGSEQAGADDEAAWREREVARRERKRLEKEAARRKHLAAQAQSMRSKRNVDKNDHDTKSKIDLARVTGKDGQAGRLLSQMSGRLKQAREREENARVKKRYELDIWQAGARSRRDTLLRVPAGSLPLGEGRCLRFPDLAMRPDDRVALSGPNGGGKSTLVRHILDGIDLPRDRLVYLPQEIDRPTARRVLDEVRRLPDDVLGRTLTAVSRLGSRPQRLLETDEPSPGEVRKLLLALGIAREPHLIVMDEPTNHLDLPAIECLETAFDDCPCALLLVSHDRRFLQRLTHKSWRVTPRADEPGEFVLEVSLT